MALAIGALGREIGRSRAVGDLYYLAVMLAALLLALWQIKFLPYASLLAIAPIAVAIGRLGSLGAVSAPTVRLAAAIVCSQWFLLVLVAQFAAPTATAARATASGSDQASCYRRDHLAGLASLRPGLILAPIDLGAHLLAETPHAVVAAPYHRIATSILATHAAFAATSPNVAREHVRGLRADYVVVCPAMTRLVTDTAPQPASLYGRLLAGESLDFLAPVAMPATSPFKVWRVR
jgi:hypothetical protein